MINRKIIYRVLGALLVLETLLFLTCLGMGYAFGENPLWSFGLPAAIAAATGLILHRCGHGGGNSMSRRDGYLCVSLSWILFTVVGTLPFLFSGHEPRLAAAFFESMSGFTTTGATAMTDIDTLPHSLLLWRSLIHWFGGLGIVFFTIAILPSMGAAGDMKLFTAEATGLKNDKIHPRIGITARWLWGVYLVLTLTCTAAYYLGGMTPFDAVNYAFSTVSTGGFATHQASFAYFHSPTLEVIAGVFMFLSGVNFTLLYLLIIKGGLKRVWRDSELRCYVTLLVLCIAAITATLVVYDHYPWPEALRHSFFNATSLQSSTGMTSAVTAQWPPLTWIFLILLSAFGGCAGSTAGGIKCIRLLTSLKLFAGEFRRLLHPSAVLPLRLNQTPVTANVSHSVFAFLVAYVVLMFGGALLYLVMGFPLLDAFSMAISMLSNAGPAFGHSVGALDTWASLPDAALWLSSFLMLAGRLEIFSLLLPFVPAFWRDN